MASLDDFLIDVEAEVEQCPYKVKVNAIRQALREFCRRTLVWQEDYSTTAANGVQEYDLETDQTDAEVVGILRILLDSVELKPKSRDDLNRWSPTWRTTTSDSGGQFYTQPDPDKFWLVPFITVTAPSLPMEITQALQPTIDAETIADVLAQRYSDTVAMGAKYRLMRMAGKSWANGAASNDYMARFNRECDKLRAKVDKNFTDAPLTVRPLHKFA